MLLALALDGGLVLVQRFLTPVDEGEIGVILFDSVGPGTFLDGFQFIGDNGWLIWHKVVEQLELSAAALAVAIAIAIPIGVVLGHYHRGSFVAINVSNIGRALPSLAVVAIGISILGISFTNVMVALVILAVPPMLTNAYVAVDEVDRDVVQAARGMGMRERDVLFRVELPLSLPLLFGGIRTAAVYVVVDRHASRPSPAAAASATSSSTRRATASKACSAPPTA